MPQSPYQGRLNVTRISGDNQIFINNKNVGYHEDGVLYRFGPDGFSVTIGTFDNRRELEALIRETWDS